MKVLPEKPETKGFYVTFMNMACIHLKAKTLGPIREGIYEEGIFIRYFGPGGYFRRVDGLSQ
jgi:hypothetical protein